MKTIIHISNHFCMLNELIVFFSGILPVNRSIEMFSVQHQYQKDLWSETPVPKSTVWNNLSIELYKQDSRLKLDSLQQTEVFLIFSPSSTVH